MASCFHLTNNNNNNNNSLTPPILTLPEKMTLTEAGTTAPTKSSPEAGAPSNLMPRSLQPGSKESGPPITICTSSSLPNVQLPNIFKVPIPGLQSSLFQSSPMFQPANLSFLQIPNTQLLRIPGESPAISTATVAPFLHRKPSPTASFPQLQNSSAVSFPEQQTSPAASFPLQHTSISASIPLQHTSLSASFPQLQTSPTASFPQAQLQNSSATSFPTQQTSPAASFPTQQTSPAASFPLQQTSLSASFPPQQTSHAASFPLQHTSLSASFPTQQTSPVTSLVQQQNTSFVQQQSPASVASILQQQTSVSFASLLQQNTSSSVPPILQPCGKESPVHSTTEISQKPSFLSLRPAPAVIPMECAKGTSPGNSEEDKPSAGNNGVSSFHVVAGNPPDPIPIPSSSLLSITSERLKGLGGLTTSNLSSLNIPNIASNIKPASSSSSDQATVPSPVPTSNHVANIISNSLNGQLEINKQLMTCLSVALEEIKELRKQLAQRTDTDTQSSSQSTDQMIIKAEPLHKSIDSPSKLLDHSSDNVSTPGSDSPFHNMEQQQNSPGAMIDIKSLLKLGENKEWTVPVVKNSETVVLGSKRSRTGEKLKSNVPAACRSIVKNVYRELVRREAISAFDLHQGQESPHNVKIYWQVIEYIRKTTTSCVWEEADMLYAIRTYWRSLRDDRQRELSGKKYNHRRMIIRREIMKRKLKSRQKAMSLVTWSGEMKQLFEETLSLDYMSSEEEDNTVESREGPRPRVVRRIPWASETMTKCKADLDQEFKKICSARQLKATAHVYRRDHVTSSRPRPPTCPQWAMDPDWMPDNDADIKEERLSGSLISGTSSARPSMLAFNPKSPTTHQILGVSDELLKSFRETTDHVNSSKRSDSAEENSEAGSSTTLYQYPLTGQLPTLQIPNLAASTEVTMSCTSLTPSILPQPTTDVDVSKIYAENSNDILSSLSACDKALFDSVVKTLAESNPLVKEMNPIDVIMSLSMTSENLSSLLGSGDQQPDS